MSVSSRSVEGSQGETRLKTGHVLFKRICQILWNMSAKELAALVMEISNKYNVDNKNLGDLVKKIFVMSFKYIDCERLWKDLFGDGYTDWGLVGRQKEGIVGGMHTWIQLLDMFNWEGLYKCEGDISLSYPMLAKMRTHLREVGMSIAEGPGWTLVGKMKMLMMLNAVPTLKVLDVFTCNVFKRTTTQECMQFLALQLDKLYTPEEELSCLRFLLEKCVLDIQVLDQNVQIYKAQKNDLRLSLQMSRLQVVQGRPRLRDKLVVKNDEHFDAWDSYAGFCFKHQFPPILSDGLKTKLYFLASQKKWEWKNHVASMVPASRIIYERVQKYPVNKPDLPVLIRVVQELSMEGKPPFSALNNFRTQCFQGFPVSHVQRMTVTQFLHLYVTVYQAEEYWKEMWKHFIGVISVQIIRDCEAFVKKFPFDEEAFMSLLRNV